MGGMNRRISPDPTQRAAQREASRRGRERKGATPWLQAVEEREVVGGAVARADGESLQNWC